jgi:uncharacterized membrane protein YoaK (UPF0700 family)
VSYLSLNVFTAHMSGNSARLGVYLGHHGWHDAFVVIFAVGVFLVSIAAGTLIMELGARAGWAHADAVLLLGEAVLLAVFAVIGQLSQVDGRVPAAPAIRFYGLVGGAVCAIGLQTASLQRMSGQTVRTTYVSGMLTTLADEVVAVAMQRRPPRGKASYVVDELGMRDARQTARIGLIVLIWVGYISGATGGAFLHSSWQLTSLAVPVVALIVLAAASVVIRRRRPRGQRVAPAGRC